MWNLKRDYKLQYKAEGEMKDGKEFSKDGDLLLLYAHVDSDKELSFCSLLRVNSKS